MNKSRVGGVLVVAAISMLAACASNAPTGAGATNAGVAAPAASASGAAPAKSAGQPAAAAATGSAQAMTSIAPVTSSASTQKEESLYGYRRVVRHGEEYFCRREGVTGSRTQTVETCLTQAQMTAMRENSQDILRRVQDNVGAQPGLSPDGSAPQPSAAPR